jgi:hypothetical protein
MEAVTPYGLSKTSEEFFKARLNDAWNPDRDYGVENKTCSVTLLRGVRKILDIVVDSAPFTTAPTASAHEDEDGVDESKKEALVLRHDDLDLQKILVDSTGAVTGIIDWDDCMSVPRCVGYTSMPTFLRRDWPPVYSIARLPHMTWAFEQYRTVYVEAMEEFVGKEDAKYTCKSVIYQTVLAALAKYVDCRDAVETLLKDITDFRRVDVVDLWGRVGYGWPAAEGNPREKIVQLLAPE